MQQMISKIKDGLQFVFLLMFCGTPFMLDKGQIGVVHIIEKYLYPVQEPSDFYLQSIKKMKSFNVLIYFSTFILFLEKPRLDTFSSTHRMSLNFLRLSSLHVWGPILV